MRFPLDVIYFDASWRILKTVRELKPWRFSMGGWRAHAALEMQSGWFDYGSLVENEPVAFG
jgi:uncharacterized membrane protein (UPF0127 family)